MSQPVFISYARSASSLAAAALAKRLGTEVAFLDTANIDAGEEIGPGVVEALLGARVVVVFAEAAYFGRWYCLRELDVALAAFNALLDRRAPEAARNAALNVVVVAMPEGTAGLDRLPPRLRGTNWPAATDTDALAELVARRLGIVGITLGRRLEELGALEAVRATVLEGAAMPPPRSLASVARFALPGELRVSIGDAFVGRADELWRIHHELSTLRGDVSATALTGALEGGGGFGKTRLATEYLHRFGPPAFPGGLFWVNAELGDRLEEQLHGILATLDPQTPTLVAMREAGRDVGAELAAALRTRAGTPVLFVVDNVPEPEAGHPPLPLITWCPAVGDVALLVTSRAQQSVTAGVRPLRVEVLAPEAAVALLTRDYPPQPHLAPGAWAEVAEWVGHLPLALELLNAALREGVLEAGELVGLAASSDPIGPLDDSARALAGVVPAGQLRGITEALAVSYAKLAPPVQATTRLLAQLAPAPVPVALLEALGPEAADGATRAVLIGRSFLTRPVEGTAVPVFGTMHRVLAAYLRTQSPDEATELAAVCQALLDLMTPDAARDPSRWALLNACLPHAESVFVRSAEFPGPPAEAGVVLGTNIGHLLWTQGLAARARAVDEAVLERATVIWGPEHPTTLRSANNLAATLRALGDAAGARALLEQVLEAQQRLLGPEHLNTLRSTNNLATTLRALGDEAGARDLHEQVLDAYRRILGPEHPDTLLSANNLAETLRTLGDATGGRALHEQVLDAYRRLLGPEHPDTLLSANNLAATLWELGDATGAQALLEQVLEARLRLLGPLHPDTTISAWNLYSTLREASDHKGAQQVVDRHLAWLLTADLDRLHGAQRQIHEMLRAL